MNRMEVLRRYIVLFAGIFFIALGVSMFTKSGLGTSAISVIPLTLSLKFTVISYGAWVAFFNIFLVSVTSHRLVISLRLFFCGIPA